MLLIYYCILTPFNLSPSPVTHREYGVIICSEVDCFSKISFVISTAFSSASGVSGANLVFFLFRQKRSHIGETDFSVFVQRSG